MAMRANPEVISFCFAIWQSLLLISVSCNFVLLKLTSQVGWAMLVKNGLVRPIELMSKGAVSLFFSWRVGMLARLV